MKSFYFKHYPHLKLSVISRGRNSVPLHQSRERVIFLSSYFVPLKTFTHHSVPDYSAYWVVLNHNDLYYYNMFL